MDPLYLVRLAGIEPTTPWFVAKYSIQLSYSREEPELYRDFQILQMFFCAVPLHRLARRSRERAQAAPERPTIAVLVTHAEPSR